MPERLEEIGFYFEVWLLKLTGYLPQWRSCALCKREFEGNETAGVGTDQELVCNSCRRTSSMVEIGPAQRETLAASMRLSPLEFASSDFDDVSLRDLGEIFKRVISLSLGRPVTESRPVAFNFH